MTKDHCNSVRIGIDVGGTFTDFVIDSGSAAGPAYLKEPSTPSDPSDAVITGMRRIFAELGFRPRDVESITHGTTIGLNTTIQRTGARTALVISEGHRDVLEMTRRLPEQYNLRQPPAKALIPRRLVVGINARLNARGEITARPTVAELDAVADQLLRMEVEAVAISVLHGYLKPDFEQDIGDEISERLPGIPVVSASHIWPEIREYNRSSIGVLNAYIAPLMQVYLSRLQSRMSTLGINCALYVTGSNGGSLGVAAAAERPVDTILSGPASGVTATLALARTGDLAQTISFDMGGTSSDIAVTVEGEAEFSTRTEVGGIPLILPVVDVSAIGAGGGSIARVDAQTMLHVGPESTGADPGPAAYGLGGTRATITDAYIVNGILSPDRFLGGAKKLDRTAAVEAVDALAADMGLAGPERAHEAAEAILTLATVGMAAELQKVMSRRGYNASEFVLVPFGGAGPTHAAILAEEIGVSTIVVPLAAGTYCALGAVGAPLRRDFLVGIGRGLDNAVAAQATTLLDDLFEQGSKWVGEQGTAVQEIDVRGALEMRYLGQAFELPVPIEREALPLSAADIARRFHDSHLQEFGQGDTLPETVVAAQLTAIGTVRPLVLGDIPSAAQTGFIDARSIYYGADWISAREVQPEQLPTTGDINGPAVLDLQHTTIFVPPGWTVARYPGNSMLLTRVATPEKNG